jgi:hypothetical protein
VITAPQPPSETIVENLHAWAEITDLCLMLRRAVLARYETTLDRVYLGRWAERLGLDPGGVGGA